MPKFVYGTDESDFIDVSRFPWFDRDGATDGDDWIFGGGGDDFMDGGDGNDLLQGGEGADYLFGGGDIDTAIYSDSPYGVYVDLQAGKGHGGTAEGDQLTLIENVTGSWWGDHLIGNSNDNALSGLGGNDDLEGGAGADTLDGGWGVDRAIYSDSPEGVTVSLVWGSASGGDAEGDKLISIESLYGSKYDDGLFGDNGANSLQGDEGDDTLFGFGDDDYLEGSIGFGSLNGGGGNDTLYGGSNGDTLAGGPGADTFLWVSNDESGGVLPSGDVDWANMDVVLDFTPGEDKIDVASVDANTVDLPFSPDDNFIDAFTFIGEYFTAGGFTAPGQVAYVSDGTDTYLIFNTDNVFAVTTANGIQMEYEFAIRFPGQHTPDASWFEYL
jgi:Ca2+-binding RTX toxin-like protein